MLGVGVSLEGAWAAWNIGAKALLGATVSILLTATTGIPELLKGLTRLRVPAIFVCLISFMVRYLELIIGDLGRMRSGMAARCYRPRWLWQAKPLAAAAGSLFIRSYERGERIHAAMLARGLYRCDAGYGWTSRHEIRLGEGRHRPANGDVHRHARAGVDVRDVIVEVRGLRFAYPDGMPGWT